MTPTNRKATNTKTKTLFTRGWNSKESGVEKNDDLQWNFHQKINWWDAATNVLLVEKQQEVPHEIQRTKHPYEKKKTSCWLESGKEESARKVPRISTTESLQKNYRVRTSCGGHHDWNWTKEEKGCWTYHTLRKENRKVCT